MRRVAGGTCVVLGTLGVTAVAWDAAAAVTVSDPVTVATGLVGYWSFDAADVSGNTLFDRSGNGSDAIGYNTTATTGHAGQARHFNGSNSYAPVAADTNLRLTGDRTLSLWLRTTNVSRYEGVISKYEAAGAESGYLLRTTAAGLLDLRIGGNNIVGGGGRDAIDTRKINDGVWHHVVVLIQLGNGVTFYVDGVRTSVTAWNIQAGPGGATFQLGLNPFLEFGEHFNGDLDEVRVYNRLLSDTEVATLYQPGAGGDTVPPTVLLTAPANNQTLTGTVAVAASASDNAGVAGVQFTVDGAALGAEDGTAPYAVSWDTTQSTNGLHSLTAIARDTSGNVATATTVVVTLSNDLTPPAVALTAPGNNQTVSNSVAVSATASDDVGVVGVQFKLDGANLGAEDLTVPYGIVWDTTSVGNGPHTLSAVARDAAGNQSNAVALAVTVGNPASPTAGLVGFWSFDNADVSGNVLRDRSGNGSDAIGYNTTSITGRVGQARHFTGASSFAPVSSDSNLRLTGDRTLAMWLRTSNNSRYEGLLCRYEASGLEFGYLLRTTPAGMLEVRIGGNNLATGGSRNATDTQKINDGGWHHAVAMIRPGVGVTFYVDGVRTSSTALPILTGTGGATFQMGSNPWLDYGNYFTGDLDEVRVFNRILSDGEVGTLYRPGSSGDNFPPSVTLTAPANNQTLSNSVTVSAAASDNVGVAGVQFKLDGGNLGAENIAPPYAVAWDTTQVTNGLHTLTALARDAAGNQASATSVTVTVNNAALPPTVAITAPATGQTVFGSISVTATAAAPAGVAGVQFQLDGASLGAEDVASPYAITWDTTQTSNGPHTLSAVVRDAVGNHLNSAAVTITVSNSASPANGLVGFWTFDTADVNGSVFLDRSGNGSDATGYNTVAITGVIGQARRFNGLNSFAPVTVDTKLQLTGDRTFSFWLRTTNNSRWEGLLSHYEAAGSEAGYLVRTAASGMIEVRLGGNNVADGTCRVIPDTQKINDGNWHHAVVMIKLGTGISFYIDGVRTSTTAVPVISGTASQAFQIGANPWLHWGNYYTGDLDQVRIYNRLLSDADVGALYQEGASVTPKHSPSLRPLIADSNSAAALAANRTLDTDGDGLTDEQEMLAGTDPTNACSRLQILLIVANPALHGVALTWTTVPGQAYQVQYSKTPSGPWHEDLPHSQLTAGLGQWSLTYTNTTAARAGCRYYKVRLVPGSGAPALLATTEVVGVYDVTLRRGDNPLAVPLQRLAEYRGAVASTANSNTVTLGSAAGFAPGQFGPQNGRPQYLLLVRQDATASPGIAGDWWPITGNSATQISVANGPDNLANLLTGGTQIEIRHLVTLQDLFGSALASTDQVWVGDGAGVGSPITYQAGGAAGYYQNGVWLGDGSQITLDPDQAVTVSRPAGRRAVALRWVGQVQMTPLTHYLVPGDNLIGSPFPVAARLDESGLASSGWVADANLQANAAEEDLFQAVGPGWLGAAVYYHNGTVSAAGWYVGRVRRSRVVLLPGRAYRFSIKAGTGMLRWRQPVPLAP